MRRFALEKLEQWKGRKDRKPLLVRGARQVGKTWLMKAFGQKAFARTAYINFDNNAAMRAVFDGDYDVRRLLAAFQIECGFKINSADTLIILDEIQEVPKALASLKYFCENAPEYAIVAAGSLLGLADRQGTGFPVGKVMFLDLYPMSFSEFLLATGNEALLDALKGGDWQLITAMKTKYVDLLRQYFFVGGMPEAVGRFAATEDFAAVREVQERLLIAYENDFSKHAPAEIVPRIRLVWNSIPAQLAKENRKFFYGSLKTGARAKDFELAIQWLCDAGLVYRIERVSKPEMPLASYAGGGFKLYTADVGLLAAKSGLDVRTLLEGSRIFTEFKGALTEQFVQQQMRAELSVTPFYWSADRGDAEIDLLFQQGSKIIPVEVKAAENLKAKSLVVYRDKFQPSVSVRVSMSDYRDEGWLINCPLYAVGEMVKIMAGKKQH